VNDIRVKNPVLPSTLVPALTAVHAPTLQHWSTLVPAPTAVHTPTLQHWCPRPLPCARPPFNTGVRFIRRPICVILPGDSCSGWVKALQSCSSLDMVVIEANLKKQSGGS
jgi:hypothetical protein